MLLYLPMARHTRYESDKPILPELRATDSAALVTADSAMFVTVSAAEDTTLPKGPHWICGSVGWLWQNPHDYAKPT